MNIRCAAFDCIQEDLVNKANNRGILDATQVAQAHDVPMGPSGTSLVLDELVSELVGWLLQVPLRDGAGDRAAPAGELFDRVGELKEMRTDAADLVQR